MIPKESSKREKEINFDSFMLAFSQKENIKEPPLSDKPIEELLIPPKFEEKTSLKTTHPEVHIPKKYRSYLDELLEEVITLSGSDLHLSCGLPPIFRINGELKFSEYPQLTEVNLQEIISEIMPKNLISNFGKHGSADFSHQKSTLGRFRVNVYQHFRGLGLAFRVIPIKVPLLKDLELPPQIADLANYKKGLILVTGATGSGKSTTLAALINEINHLRKAHIITIEDPIEFIHENKKSHFTQRELGRDVVSFSDGIHSALRADPDIILVGEMRDLETVSEALRAAESGILVLATLHTNSAPKAIDRIIDIFPSKQQPQIRSSLSTSLKAVLAQQLLKRIDKKGRCAAIEILLSVSGLANIIREGNIHYINSIIQTGKQLGMQTMDQALIELYQKRIISYDLLKERISDFETLTRLGIYFEE